MAKKKVLVCGATGFIGRNVLENISDNSQWEVIADNVAQQLKKLLGFKNQIP